MAQKIPNPNLPRKNLITYTYSEQERSNPELWKYKFGLLEKARSLDIDKLNLREMEKYLENIDKNKYLKPELKMENPLPEKYLYAVNRNKKNKYIKLYEYLKELSNKKIIDIDKILADQKQALSLPNRKEDPSENNFFKRVARQNIHFPHNRTVFESYFKKPVQVPPKINDNMALFSRIPKRPPLPKKKDVPEKKSDSTVIYTGSNKRSVDRTIYSNSLNSLKNNSSEEVKERLFYGSGTGGNVYSPIINTGEKDNYSGKRSYVGKLFSDQKTFDDEIAEQQKLADLDPDDVFIIKMKKYSNIDLQQELFNELKKAKKVDNLKSNFREQRVKYTHQIVYPYGGVSYDSYLTKQFSSTSNPELIQQEFEQFIFPIMFLMYWIGDMNVNKRYSHFDIKDANILFKGKVGQKVETGRLYLIDFGLSSDNWDKVLYDVIYNTYIIQGVPLFYPYFSPEINAISSLYFDPNIQETIYDYIFNEQDQFLYYNTILNIDSEGLDSIQNLPKEYKEYIIKNINQKNPDLIINIEKIKKIKKLFLQEAFDKQDAWAYGLTAFNWFCNVNIRSKFNEYKLYHDCLIFICAELLAMDYNRRLNLKDAHSQLLMYLKYVTGDDILKNYKQYVEDCHCTWKQIATEIEIAINKQI
jgi:hypothetical protein